MELREKIASLIFEQAALDFSDEVSNGLELADAILAIPELKAALELAKEVADGRR